MTVLARHVVHQRKMVTALGGIALEALLQRFDRRKRGPVSFPREPITERIAPPPRALVRDYVHHLGGDVQTYDGLVPPHLFPQWCLPLAARTLRGLPFPLLKIVNSGCRVEINAPLSAAEALDVVASLESIETDEGRTVLRQRIVTSQSSRPRALVVDLRAVVPSSGPRRRNRSEPVRVPDRAERVDAWRLERDAGMDFALLTGDFNPIHWLSPYARAFGFESAILHGFATMARVLTGLETAFFSGVNGTVHVLDVRFTRPLVLPAEVGLFVENDAVFVGVAGEPAYLTGTFTAKEGAERSPRGSTRSPRQHEARA